VVTLALTPALSPRRGRIVRRGLGYEDVLYFVFVTPKTCK